MFIFPLIAMLLVRIANDNKSVVRTALMLSLISLADTIWKITLFDPHGGMQFVFDQYWIEDLGISLKFGLDGVGLLMVLLTNALVPLIIYSSFNREIRDYKNYYSLIFLMQFALIGVFSSLDGFLFYVFWEIALIPIWSYASYSIDSISCCHRAI